ncbi:MAG: M28 family peptidase, partial [Candidatus Atribacteria bacterium]|nr:M28 family peptidase [Candidatus Atribacteria bacterium]
LLIGISGWLVYNTLRPATHFDGQRAYQDVLAQVSLGARTPGSDSHAQTVATIQQELEKAGWKVQIQATEWQGFSVQNIIASRSELAPRIVVGAHYDSRLLADQDPGPGRSGPVPGANDGASGVAVLLELARTLSSDSVPVWLVFFDAEDNGGLDNRQWIMGSRAFVAALTEKPQAAVIVDMVGDADLNIYIERNSDAAITSEIWAQAAALGYGNNFIATPKYDMIDDHTPFLEAGIPAVDIIDFDYPYWHTAADTADKVSAQSLQAVGETLWAWIESQK